MAGKVARELNRKTKLPAVSFAGQKRELLGCKSPVLNQFLDRPQLLHRSAPARLIPIPDHSELMIYGNDVMDLTSLRLFSKRSAPSSSLS